MSEQDRTHVSTKPRRSRPASTQKTTLQRPANDDKEAWKAYWKQHGQTWRTEPEIDTKRQKYLAERRIITPNIGQGIYPFKGEKLSRADVEWLLATHDNGRGPVNWEDESQREREGLDLRGADLSGANLQALPLARIIAGVNKFEFEYRMSDDQLNAAITNLEGVEFRGAHLEGAYFYTANLVGAHFMQTHLEEAEFTSAHLEGAYFFYAHLEGAEFTSAHLEGAGFDFANLEGANLMVAHLAGANFYGAYLERTNLDSAHLEGTRLDKVFFDSKTRLDNVTLSDNKHGTVSLADVHWSDTILQL